jgi:SAM-dependent methyltransferase
MSVETNSAAEQLQATCAKVAMPGIENQWSQAQRAEEEFWRGFAVRDVEKQVRRWRDFANFLHSAANRVRRLDQNSYILQIGAAALDGIDFFPNGHRVSVDPLSSAYRKNVDWARAWRAGTLVIDSVGESLPLRSSVFDLVILNNMIDHVARPIDVLRESVRVLRGGGLLFLGVNVFPASRCEELRTMDRHDPCHLYVFSKQDVLSMLKLCDLSPLCQRAFASSDAEMPEQQYFAVFSSTLRPREMYRLPAGCGWVPLDPMVEVERDA